MEKSIFGVEWWWKSSSLLGVVAVAVPLVVSRPSWKDGRQGRGTVAALKACLGDGLASSWDMLGSGGETCTYLPALLRSMSSSLRDKCRGMQIINCGSVPVCQENPLTSNRWAVLKSPPSWHPSLSHGPQVETSFQSLKIFRLFSSPARGICMQVPFIQTPSCCAHILRSLPRAWKSSIHFPFELVEPSPSGTWSRGPSRASHPRATLQAPATHSLHQFLSILPPPTNPLILDSQPESSGSDGGNSFRPRHAHNAPTSTSFLFQPSPCPRSGRLPTKLWGEGGVKL